MIRWEEQESGEWTGYSGQVVVATAKPAAVGSERWNWEVTGAGRLKGARNSGHRTNELDARRAADSYWQRWLEATALRPDLQRLAQESLAKRSGRNQRPPPSRAPVVQKAEALTKAQTKKWARYKPGSTRRNVVHATLRRGHGLRSNARRRPKKPRRSASRS